jgi:hypothetical protein
MAVTNYGYPYGSDVEVVEPKEFRQLIHERLESVLAQYRSIHTIDVSLNPDHTFPHPHPSPKGLIYAHKSPLPLWDNQRLARLRA